MTNSYDEIEKAALASALLAGGFMGTDPRPLEKIISADRQELGKLGCSAEMLADMLEELSCRATTGLGSPVSVIPGVSAHVNDIRGSLPCPWTHPGTYRKAMTEADFDDDNPALRWSDLSIHLIREHGFFQGHGSPFRMEPAVLNGLFRKLYHDYD